VRREWHAKRNSITRIPSSARAHPIKQHAGSEFNTLSELGASAKASFVLKHDEGERGRNYPTRGAAYPVPAEFARIELHVVVDRAEFPTP
jgi:hypothetical protein